MVIDWRVAKEIIANAKFYASAKNARLWFLPCKNIVFMVEERCDDIKKEVEYTLYAYTIEEFSDFLENYWRGSRTFENWHLDLLTYANLEKSWSREELIRAKNWVKVMKRFQGEPEWLFIDGIRRGFYLLEEVEL